MRLLISMGIRPGAHPREPLRPRLVELDVDRDAITRVWEPPVHPDHLSGLDADQELTAAAFAGPDRLLQPTLTSVHILSARRFELHSTLSHPLMHSVHSAVPRPGGGITVSCAGTDSVLELDADGALLRHHWLAHPEGRPEGFSRAHPGVHDFRKAHHDAFKPHAHHPNHAFYVGEELWVTCFQSRCCRSLSRPGRVIHFPEGIPHDGRQIGDWMWFTLVQGHVIAVDPVSLERRIHLDLGALDPRPEMPGWCRGIEVVGSRLFVGMSMLRRTTHREVLRLLLRGIRGKKLPTRVVEVDLDGPRIRREFPLGNAAGGTIYGVLNNP